MSNKVVTTKQVYFIRNNEQNGPVYQGGNQKMFCLVKPFTRKIVLII